MRRSRARGFTLIELLAALVVLASMAGLLLSGAQAGRRTWERAETRENGVDAVASVQRILRDRIEGAVPIPKYGTRVYADLSGDARSLFFYGPPPAGERPGSVRVYRLSQSTGAELVLSDVDDLSPDPARARRDRVLLKNVREVGFSYFGSATPDGQRRWRDSWIEQPAPPELIRMRVDLSDGREWPDLVARPAATVDLDCVLNLINGRCKGR